MSRLLCLLLLLYGLPILAGGEVTFPLTWRWSNPTPHGNNIIDMAAANGLVVQVSERGQIYTSSDLTDWIPAESHTTNALRAVTFFGSRIIVVGENGTVLRADSVTDFKLVNLGTEDWLEGVAASPNLLVAVGDNAAVYTSSDGTVWQFRPQSFTAWLRSVAFGSGTFVAVGEGGFIASSTDGIRWQPRSSGTTTDLNRIAWLSDRFLVAGDKGITLTSSTGGVWQPVVTGATNALFAAGEQSRWRLVAGDAEARSHESALSWSNELDRTKPSPAPTWTYYDAVDDGFGFLLGGRTGVIVEGITNLTGRFDWTTHSDTIRNWLWDVTRSTDIYLAVGDRATVMTSGNGLDWELELVPNSVTNSIFLGVGGTTNLVIAVGDKGSIIFSANTLTNVAVTNLVAGSLVVTNELVNTLGILWSAVEPRPTTSDLQGVGTFGDLLIVTGDKGTVLTSPNGINWIPRPAPTTAFLSSVVAYPGGVAAVGDRGTILTSSDSINWNLQNSGTTNWVYRVRYLGGKLIGVGQNGTILTSDNGTIWNRQASGTVRWLNDVTFVGGTFFIVGTQGTVLESSDAINWTNIGTITEKSLSAATTYNGQLISVGIEGIILRSQVVAPSAPGILTVTPANDFASVGFTGGPFNPPAQIYLLSNSGNSPLAWTANNSQQWFGLSTRSGALGPNSSVSVTVSISAGAQFLAAGFRAETIAFNNVTDGKGNTTRNFSLSVYPPPLLSVLPGSSPSQFHLRLAGVPSQTCLIQASSDLLKWLPIATNFSAPNGFLDYTDIAAGNFQRRFYRAVITP